MPEVKLLSNGSYHVMLTSAGGGYSRWHDVAVTRWREDATLDNWGAFCYLRDCTDGAVWSTTVQPAVQSPDTCNSSFSGAGLVRFSRRDHAIETRTEIAVSFDDDVELLRVRLTNLSERPRTLTATSLAQIVLASPTAHSSPLSFSTLFF